MAGRPTKYSDEVVARILNAVKAGLTNKDAALCAGIDERTLQRWVCRYVVFDAQLAHARAQRSALLLAKMVEFGLNDRDWRALGDVLDRTAPEYRKVQKTEQSITFDVRKAAEKVAADLGVPADLVLAESYRMAEDDG